MKPDRYKNKSAYKGFLATIVILVLSACGGGSSEDASELDAPLDGISDNSASDDADNTPSDLPTMPMLVEQPPIIDPTTELDLDTQNSPLLDDLAFEPLGDEDDTPRAEDNGDLLPRVFPTQTNLNLDYAQAGAALVEQLNESFALPADIDVNFVDCGTANAFFATPDDSAENSFISSGGAIFMCHELNELFGQFFGNTEQAFAASIFVLLHELGHALVDQLNLPVLGIEESYVDGIAAVLVGESGLSEASVFAGWFFGNQGPTPFFDSHRAGPQRLGDLACWGVGADPSLLEDPIIASITEQLVIGGRDCPAEYEQQRRALEFVLGPNIRGGLENTFTTEDLPTEGTAL